MFKVLKLFHASQNWITELVNQLPCYCNFVGANEMWLFFSNTMQPLSPAEAYVDYRSKIAKVM